MCERIADPGLSAFAYHPVPHFGLSFDMQRKKHEGVEEARGSRCVNFTLEFAFVLCCQPENLFILLATAVVLASPHLISPGGLQGNLVQGLDSAPQ